MADGLRDKYKLVLDTLRIRLANVIAELATTLAPMLPRPAEAKKTLDNLLAAPAVIHATRDYNRPGLPAAPNQYRITAASCPQLQITTA